MKLVNAFLLLSVLSPAAEKSPPSGQAANDKLAIEARLFIGKDAVRGELGSDLGGDFLLVKVKLTPRSGKLAVIRDDFLLRNTDNGQRCRPYAPTQIAGGSALVISSAGTSAVMAEDPHPVRIPQMGGPPVRIEGPPQSAGNAPVESGTANATVRSPGKGAKEDPVLGVLKDKVLPEREIGAPLEGLLYFSLEGKQKAKNLELVYEGAAGKLLLKFR
jgi:hypothetical protein